MPRLRLAGPADAPAVARLHAESWRRHYRGAYADSFLDGEVLDERVTAWSERLSAQRSDSCTVLAEGERLVGFAHVIFDEDPRWGSLLDNLHVAAGRQRQGVGTRLLARVAQAILAQARGPRLYAWVLEQNAPAQAFYAARGAKREAREPASPPGGVAGRLAGSPAKLRLAWPHAGVLLAHDTRERRR